MTLDASRQMWIKYENTSIRQEAAKNCPAWLGRGVVKHIGFPDPAKADGTEEERMALFRQVRDGLREQVIAYLESDVADGDVELEVYLNATRNLST